MSEAGRLMDYDFGNKGQWRRTVWSQLLRRVKTDRKKDGVFLYLGGETDFDRRLLESKGVRPCNIICIDQNRDIARRIRKSGGLCIQADIWDVLSSWPSHYPIAAASLDFCCPLTPTVVVEFPELFINSEFPFSVNLLRGREQDDSCKKLLRIKKDVLMRTFLQHPYKGNLGTRFLNDDNIGIHRGYNALSISVGKMMDMMIPDSVVQPSVDLNIYFMDMMEMLRASDPFFYSYISNSGQVFDTIILSPLPRDKWRTGQETIINDEKKYIALRRQISAILAHRTMRMRGAA